MEYCKGLRVADNSLHAENAVFSRKKYDLQRTITVAFSSVTILPQYVLEDELEIAVGNNLLCGDEGARSFRRLLSIASVLGFAK